MNTQYKLENLLDNEGDFSFGFKIAAAQLFNQAVDERVKELLLLEKSLRPKNWLDKSENKIQRALHERILVKASPVQKQMAMRAAKIGKKGLF